MSTRVNVPDLKKYMDKRLLLQLNCNRKVTGVLRGFDPFMNVVLDEAVEERSAEQRLPIGLTVCASASAPSHDALDGPRKQHSDGRGAGEYRVACNKHIRHQSRLPRTAQLDWPVWCKVCSSSCPFSHSSALQPLPAGSSRPPARQAWSAPCWSVGSCW